MNSTPDPQTDRSHRTVLTVTVTSRPDGGHYIDQADFTAHVTQWLKTDLKGHHAIDQVTVDDQADDAHRLALSDALGLGTSAPWDAIRERAAELAVLPAPVDRGAVLAEGIAAIEAERDATDVNVAVYPRYDGKERIALGSAIRVLRRLADAEHRCPHGCDISHCPCLACEAEQADEEPQPECPGYETTPNSCSCDCEGCRHNCAAHNGAGAPQPETQAAPRRGDAVEQWLKAQRDEYQVESSPQWGALDEVLDTYRLHADTGTPLGEHVCEGRVAGDCDCLEKPAAFEADLASKTSPKADAKAEIVHGCPPDGSGLTPCCGRTPFELPLGDRMSSEAPVTCTAPAVTPTGKEA